MSLEQRTAVPTTETNEILPAAEGAVTQLLDAFNAWEVGHTDKTPERAAKAWAHRLAGYSQDPRHYLRKTFPAPDNTSLIVTRNIRIESTCAHHLLPITGTARIAYRPQPGQKIVGLSKLNRLANGYARRLQVQEKLTHQILHAIWDELNPQWVACAIEAKHGCMTIRGVEDSCTDTLTFDTLGTPADGDMTAFWR